MNKLIVTILFLLSLTLMYGQKVIKLNKESGIYTLPCKVNGVQMKFIYDTGASQVSISIAEAMFLAKNGLLEDQDILGSQSFQDATGKISEGKIINLRELNIDGIILNNVKATVVNNIRAPLLLGQNVLAKLGRITFDPNNGTLTLLDNYSQSENIIVFDDGARWEGPIYEESNRISPDGKGVMYEIDGSVYKGSYHKGRRSGYGEMYFKNGDVYKGQWLVNSETGRGVIIRKNGISEIVINGLTEKEIKAEEYFNNGDLKYQSEDYKGAIVDFTKAINLNYNKIGVYYFRGQCKQYLEDYKGAIEDFDILINLDSKNSFSYFARAGFKTAIEDYKGAISDYSKSIELDELDLDSDLKGENYRYRGYCKYMISDYKGAIEDLNSAIKEDPEDASSYHYRSIAKYKLDDKEGACKDLKKADELGYEDAKAVLLEICK